MPSTHLLVSRIPIHCDFIGWERHQASINLKTNDYEITDSETKFENLRHECIIQHAFKHNYILDILHPTVSSLVAENARIQTIIVGKYGWDKNDANGFEKRNLLDLLLEMRHKRFSNRITLWKHSIDNITLYIVHVALTME